MNSSTTDDSNFNAASMGAERSSSILNTSPGLYKDILHAADWGGEPSK